MKRNRLVALFALTLGIGVTLSPAAIAFAQTPPSSGMARYTLTVQTPEDHQHAASLFDHHAVKAEAFTYNYTDQFRCVHSKSTELQRYGAPYPLTDAQRYCRKMLRHYVNAATQNRELAEHHRNVAAQMTAMYR